MRQDDGTPAGLGQSVREQGMAAAGEMTAADTARNGRKDRRKEGRPKGGANEAETSRGRATANGTERERAAPAAAAQLRARDETERRVERVAERGQLRVR